MEFVDGRPRNSLKLKNLMRGTHQAIIEAWRTAARKVYADVMKTQKKQKIFGPYRNIMSDAAIEIR